MPSCIEEPAPKDPLVEINVVKADTVEFRPFKKHLGSIFLIPRREPDDWSRGEDHVIKGVQLEVIDLRARKHR